MLMPLLRTLTPATLRRRLRNYHRRLALARAVRSLRRHDAFVPLSDQTLADLAYGWNNPWALRAEMLCQVWDDAWHTQGPILECGSGLSTLLLAAVGERRGFEVVSLEHQAAWHRRIETLLERHRFRSVRVIHAPLTASPTYSWYDVPPDLPSGFTLVVCDGPPGDTPGGRYGLLPRMGRLLTSDCVILVDDVDRPGEQAVLGRWAQDFDVAHRVVGSDQAFAIIEPAGAGTRRVANRARPGK